MKGSRKGWLKAAGLVVSLAACAHDDGLRNRGPVVEELELVGTEAVEPGDIEARILTAESSSWNPFAAKKRLDRNVWRQDLERIERYYQARGYYQARVVSADIEETGEDSVRIRVEVEEGPATRVTGVDLRGISELPLFVREAVRASVGLKEGDVFLEEPWSTLPGRIQSVLVNHGYAEARVNADAKVDLALHTAALTVEVEPGARYRVERVEVKQQPSPQVAEWRIREQAEVVLDRFDHYSEELRDEVQQRVFDMGVFGAVQVSPGKGDPATGTLPLHVETNEAPFHELAYGVGFGFEQRRQEGHLLTEYTDRDFLGGIRRLTLRAEGGYAFIPSIYTVARGRDAVIQSGPIARLQAELEQPRVFHPDLRLNTRLLVEKEIEPAYAYTGGRARFGLPWRPTTRVTLEPSYNIELYRLSAGQTTLGGTAPQLLFGCDQTCVLSFLEERVAYDRRDDPQEPRRGYYLALALQQGGGPLGGSFDYLRVVPEARAYRSFLSGRRLTLGTRVRVGTLIPLGGASELDTPVVARFFSGGDEMRGFSTQRLSPMRLAEKREPEGDYNAEPVPIGGNGLFEASVEARYRLTKAFTVATFVDTGFVTTSHTLNDDGGLGDNLLWAVGTGVRYRTPVGPVRLDLAYRLPFGPPLKVYDTPGQDLRYLPSSGCFGLGSPTEDYGGSPEGLCSIHLSIGEAF